MDHTKPPAADLVRAFHVACGLPVAEAPRLPSVRALEQRLALLREEFAEVEQAAAAGDLPGLAQELADLVYVAYGSALVCGVDLDAVIRAVHAANMAKQPPATPGGKATKPAGWQAPDVAGVLARQAEGDHAP